ncbi:acyl-CoA N-acyltransferase [Hypoxylon rubiginosum]|uniref:Acyl-CoA N-acyltransferase n=1 Tax=Hypoxylon rubiginosum TaxID=110542 RepID=A0ACB9Z963_9PEZI|nr:acyl-CoA N-acyltransferase [Hypoxylon rubiginosum]
MSAQQKVQEHEKVKVKTVSPTQPLPPNSERKAILTERLIIRPVSEDDVDGVHAIHRQPEVMKYTLRGRIDDNKEMTLASMGRFMPPNDLHTYSNVICLASTGEIIGTGGISTADRTFGWPEVGYLFNKEAWGQGYATEFLKALVSFWWTLPRSEIELGVVAESVDGPGEAPEMLSAIIDASNIGSQRVLQKTGFQEFKRWFEPDIREGHSGDVLLVGFVLSSAGQEGYRAVGSGGPVLEPTDQAPV